MQPLFEPPQKAALREAIAYVWNNERKCKKEKCKLTNAQYAPVCGTCCLLVTKRLAQLDQLESVMVWQGISKAKVGVDPIVVGSDFDSVERQLRATVEAYRDTVFFQKGISSNESSVRGQIVELAITVEDLERKKSELRVKK